MQVSATYATTIAADLGGDDQTTAIRDFLASVPDGTPDAPTVIRFDAGRYHTEGDLANNPRGINGCILFESRHNLIIEGPDAANPAIFFTTAPAVSYNASVANNTQSERRHFWFKNCTNITVRNIRVEGSNYTAGPSLVNGTPAFWLGGPDTGSLPGYPGYHACWEFEHAFAFHECQNMLVENCQADSVWGDFVYLGNKPTEGTDGVTISGGKGRWCGRQGISGANCRNILVTGVELDHIRRSAFDWEPFSNSGWVTDVEIENCILYPRETHFAAIGMGDVSRINIHDNTLNGPSGTIDCKDSAGLKRRTDWIFVNNVRLSNFGSPVAPIKFTMTDNVVVDGNRIPIVTTQSRKCVKFDNCGGALSVTNNDFRALNNATAGGLYIEAINSASVTNTGNTPGLTIL